jgi:hypothetical protein
MYSSKDPYSLGSLPILAIGWRKGIMTAFFGVVEDAGSLALIVAEIRQYLQDTHRRVMCVAASSSSRLAPNVRAWWTSPP